MNDIQELASELSVFTKASVESSLQHGILTIKVKSLDQKLCAQIVEKLNEVQPGYKGIWVNGLTWTKFFILKDGNYIENTNTVAVTGFVLIVMIGGLVTWSNLSYKPPTPPTPPPNITSQPSTQTTNPDCLYIPESTIAGKSGEEISQFKDELKRQSGKTCVLFSGG